MKKKLLLQITAVVVLSIFAANPALAITVLGNNPFHSEYLTDQADLKRVLEQKQDEVKEGLMIAGNPELYEPLFSQLTNADISKVQYYKGQEFKWMFYRRNGKGKVRIDQGVIWESDEPLLGFEFYVDHNGQRYTFAVPAICTNLALIGNEPVPVVAPPPVVPVADSSGQSGTGSPGTGTGAETAQTNAAGGAGSPFIVDAGYLNLLDPGHYVFARIGFDFPVNESFSVIAMLGGAHQFSGTDGKNAFLADVFANYNFSRFFVGAGLGAWLTSGDSSVPSEDSDLDIIINGGVRLFGEPEAFNTSLFVEVRSAVDELDEFDMYGRVGAGLRFRF